MMRRLPIEGMRKTQAAGPPQIVRLGLGGSLSAAWSKTVGMPWPDAYQGEFQHTRLV
jgi:hypothetical protein